MVIWKYALRPGKGKTYLKVPQHSTLLCIKEQRGVLCAWFLVRDEHLPKEGRIFETHGTGEPFDPDERIGRYVGTYFQYEGRVVWHVFEI